MTIRIKHPSRDGASRIAAFAVFALLFLCLPGAASAQWTTSGNTTSTNNNVGVGTSTPSQMFHVHGPSTVAGTRVTTAGTGSTYNDGVNFGYDESYGATIWNREASPIVFSTSNLERMRLDAVGNLGLGTTSTSEKLGVRGMLGLYPQTWGTPTTRGMFMFHNGVRAQLWAFDYPNGAGDPLLLAGSQLEFMTYSGTAGAQRMIINSIGNVGIGTTTPGRKLEVQVPDGSAARLYRTGSGIGWGVNMVFSLNNSNNERTDYAGIHGLVGNPTAGAEGGTLILSTATSGTISEKMRVDSGGNVGIGTTTPAARLHVAGDIKVDGNINAKYQDVAEWVPSTQKLSPGTVVILDPERPNHVLASTASYDTAVAGVISERPGLSLGEEGEGKALVATTGRVKVKVDATRTAIRIGDLIVTSDVEGVAMKSEPVLLGGRRMHAPGTIIGKALEPLAGGKGEILVLLSLQ
jgi:hypothetical protein